MDLDLFDVFDEVPESKTAAAMDTHPPPADDQQSDPDEESDEEVEEATPITGSLPADSERAQQKEADVDNFGAYVEQVSKPVEGLVGCTAEACYPPNWDFEKEAEEVKRRSMLPPEPPAKEYPFTLDPFQKTAVACLERNESVLVAAHTSAGKTAIAEYAIALSLKRGQRVVYTSPIKALSNQKYRELFEEFQDVGLMTGDITINPSASCLVMTTEILRNMLYRGSEVIREVAWVIFDEIHYMRNIERGVVWEEAIIMLPHRARMAFLSATIPNAQQFALWVAKVHSQPCSVVYTEYRPTPLQHYVFPEGGEGIYLVVDEKGNFREQQFQRAVAALASNEEEQKSGSGKWGKKKRKTGKGDKGGGDIYKILKMIMDRNYHPVIVFAFSKRDCEQNALKMAKLDFCDAEEKKMVTQIFNNAIDSLSEDDRRLPQVQNIIPLLRRGIGIHHGGLLPILKEVIEILFQEGLVKCLFATETFAMGLNMPAKTVVYTSVKKFDGKAFRQISSGEYIQMSGRAGRRGLDDKGIVILMMEEKMEPPAVKEMIKGAADPLTSSFHLGYNMLLNLMRVEETSPEFLMVRSFHQFQINRSAPALMQQLQEEENKMSEIKLADGVGIASYYHMREQIEASAKAMRLIMLKPIYAEPFLNPGRLVYVKDEKHSNDWGWGVVVNFNNMQKSVSESLFGNSDASSVVVDVLLPCARRPRKRTRGGAPPLQPCPEGEEADIQVVPCILGVITKISSIRLYLPKNLKNESSRAATGKSVAEVKRRFPDGIPLLDPLEDMKITDPSFASLIERTERLEESLNAHPWHNHDDLKTEYEGYERQRVCEAKIKELKTSIKNATNDAVLKSVLRGMKRVLRRLDFTTANNVIGVKGRVACEISTGDELIVTELIFSGAFNELETVECVALLSCFVAERSGGKDGPKTESKVQKLLSEPYKQLMDIVARISKVMQESGVAVEEDDLSERFQPTMMDVVYEWCKGAKFADICKLTDAFEGSIIRVMRRLEELLRQLSQAAKSIGNNALAEKFLAGTELLKRDIVFAASLYL